MGYQELVLTIILGEKKIPNHIVYAPRALKPCSFSVTVLAVTFLPYRLTTLGSLGGLSCCSLSSFIDSFHKVLPILL